MKRLFLPLLFIAAACSSGGDRSAAPAPMKVGGYSTDTEASPVGVIPTGVLHDSARNKDLNISIDYPARGGPFPVIIFSHPYGSSNRAYEPLISYWVSNGYVCIRPAHADAEALREQSELMAVPPQEERRERRGERRNGRQTEVKPVPSRPNPAEEIWDKQREPQWRDRAADIELIINSLDTLEKQYPELLLKMDHSKIGVAGQGYGAFTAMLLGGMRTFGNPPLDLTDPRVRAIVAFSPEGIAENRGLTAQSWADVHIPVLFMTGTNDIGATAAEDANWRKTAFDNSPAGDKYFVLLQGAGAGTFTGMGGMGFGGFEQQRPMSPGGMYGGGGYGYPEQPRGQVTVAPARSFDVVEITSLAFWDAYLKNKTSARDLLQPEKYNSSFSGATMSAK